MGSFYSDTFRDIVQFFSTISEMSPNDSYHYIKSINSSTILENYITHSNITLLLDHLTMTISYPSHKRSTSYPLPRVTERLEKFLELPISRVYNVLKNIPSSTISMVGKDISIEFKNGVSVMIRSSTAYPSFLRDHSSHRNLGSYTEL